MPITFDTLTELEDFCQAFGPQTLTLKSFKPTTESALIKTLKETQEPAPHQEKTAKVSKIPPASLLTKPKASKKLAVTDKVKKADKANAETLTAQIKKAIQNFLKKGKAFTANDIYAALSKRNPDINKSSVIVSVSRQMNGPFQHVSVTEQRGKGPRPVKCYNAA